MCRREPMSTRTDSEPRKGEGGGEGGEKVAKTEIATFPKKQDALSSLLLLESITWEKVAATFGVLPSQPPVLVGDLARFLKVAGRFLSHWCHLLRLRFEAVQPGGYVGRGQILERSRDVAAGVVDDFSCQ